MKEFIIFVELRQLFPYMAFVYAWIVPLWADQLLPQLLMEQFDTLPIQCRHIEHMHEGAINFVCTDSTEIFFSKLRSAGLNYTHANKKKATHCTCFVENKYRHEHVMITKLYIISHILYNRHYCECILSGFCACLKETLDYTPPTPYGMHCHCSTY